jgi:hypothetical protein
MFDTITSYLYWYNGGDGSSMASCGSGDGGEGPVRNGSRAPRTAELSETQTFSFLPTEDGLSEGEVLGIVCELNETIHQVAGQLTDEWVKLKAMPATLPADDVDPTPPADVGTAPQSRVSALVQQVRNRDPESLNVLLQSCLCSQVADMTSGRGRYREFPGFKAVYERLSASGEYCTVYSSGV